jgi:hypothetical protein
MSQKSSIELEKIKKILDATFFDPNMGVPYIDQKVSRDAVEKYYRQFDPDAKIVWTSDRTCEVTVRVPTNYLQVTGEVRV